MCRKLLPASVLRESIAVKVGLTAAPAADVRVGNAINTVILISGPDPAGNVVLMAVAAVTVTIQAEHAALVLEVEVVEVVEVAGVAFGVPNPPCLPAPASKRTDFGAIITVTIPSASPALTAG